MARQIIDVLIKNNFSVFILGSSVAKEEQFNEANVNDLRGTTSIREAAIIIKNSSFCLANDSGLANIAAAVNTNLICLLYGPDTDILNDPKKSKANIIRNPSLSKIITAIERFMNPKNSKPRAI